MHTLGGGMHSVEYLLVLCHVMSDHVMCCSVNQLALTRVKSTMTTPATLPVTPVHHTRRTDPVTDLTQLLNVLGRLVSIAADTTHVVVVGLDYELYGSPRDREIIADSGVVYIGQRVSRVVVALLCMK